VKDRLTIPHDEDSWEEDPERERFIEELRSGQPVHFLSTLTRTRAGLYRLALLLHATASYEGTPRLEFVAALWIVLAAEL
jgi:hypothetical protein